MNSTVPVAAEGDTVAVTVRVSWLCLLFVAETAMVVLVDIGTVIEAVPVEGWKSSVPENDAVTT